MSGIRRLSNTNDMDVGDQLLYERMRNVLLWRGFMFSTVVSLLSLSALLLVGGMYFNVTERQDKAKARGCELLMEIGASKNRLEELEC